jgi:hypothetical protein
MYRTRQERRLRRFPWRGGERRAAGARRHNGYDQTSSGSSEQRIG